MLHRSSELENTVDKRENSDESGNAGTNESVVVVLDIDASGGKIGSENSGPSNEKLTLTDAQQKYACKNLGATSDGSCTQDITPLILVLLANTQTPYQPQQSTGSSAP